MSETADMLVYQNAVFLVKELPPERLYELINRVRRTTASVKSDCLFIARHFSSEIETQIHVAVQQNNISVVEGEAVLIKLKELTALLKNLRGENYNGK